jgi:hypothetical protein
MRQRCSNVCKWRPCLDTESTNSARMRTIVTAALQRLYSQTELIFWITSYLLNIPPYNYTSNMCIYIYCFFVIFRLCIFIVMFMYSYCYVCSFLYIYCFHRANCHSSATFTQVFPCFFLSCKADAMVYLAKTGHGPHSS